MKTVVQWRCQKNYASLRIRDTINMIVASGSTMKLPGRPGGVCEVMIGFMRPIAIRINCSMTISAIMSGINSR